MPDRPTDQDDTHPERFRNPEAALGGADAVEKTTYVTGAGADPNARKGAESTSAKVPAGGGQGATWAILLFLFVGAVLVYLLGFGR